MVGIEDIVNDIKSLVDRHTQLNSFGFGRLSNINTKEFKFPLVWVELVPGRFDNNNETIKFDIYVLDVLELDLENEVRVFTDTSTYTNDILIHLIDNASELGYYIESEGIVKEPMTAKFDQHLNGFVTEIACKATVGYCDINIPITE